MCFSTFLQLHYITRKSFHLVNTVSAIGLAGDCMPAGVRHLGMKRRAGEANHQRKPFITPFPFPFRTLRSFSFWFRSCSTCLLARFLLSKRPRIDFFFFLSFSVTLSPMIRRPLIACARFVSSLVHDKSLPKTHFSTRSSLALYV